MLAPSLLLVLALAAAPTGPATLWEMCPQAELIVEATVVHEREGEVLLQVEALLKGEAPRRVPVSASAGVYPPGGRVLAFLSPSADGRWVTVNEGYGVRLLEGDEAAAEYRAVVASAHRLQARLGGPSFPALSVLAAPASSRQREIDRAGRRREEELRSAWLLEAAALPATRWDGLYELAPRLGYQSPAALRGALRVRGEALDRLAEGFVRQPPVYWGLPVLLALLEGHGGRAVTEAAMNAFETSLSEDLLFEPELTLRLLRDRLGVPPPREGVGLEDQWRQLRGEYGAPVRRLPGRRVSRGPVERVLP